MVLVAVLAAVAFVATRDDGAPGGNGLQQMAAVETSGDSLPDFVAGPNDPALGLTAPRIEGEAFDGSPVAVAAGEGPELIIFLAHWCPHCQREVPRLAEWLDDTPGPRNASLVLVATATDPNRPNYPPSEWLEREGLDLPVLADDRRGTAAEAMGLTGYPYFVLVDDQNRVVARHAGEISIDQLEALLSRV